MNVMINQQECRRRLMPTSWRTPRKHYLLSRGIGEQL